ELPYVDYNELETQTWNTIYSTIRPKWMTYACEEYHAVLALLEREIGYSATAIPQFRDVSGFLQATTGFTLHPVTGYLTPRDFLNGLAFRVFFCTQYIRHHSVPFYTQEPDICHEIMGHDADFADFSHEIGLASLGASDDEIVRLAAVYFISVEFGMYRRDGQSVRGPARDVYVRLSQPYTHDADSPMLDDKKAEGLHPRSGDVQSNVWSMRAALYAAVFSTEAAILAGAALGVMISYIISISTDVSDKLAKFDALTKAKSPMATQLAAFNELLHTPPSAPPTYLGINGTTLQLTCISNAQNISIITPMVGTDVLGKLPSTSPSDLVFDVVLNMFPKCLVGSFAQLDGFLSVSVASVVIGAATASCADENHFVLVGVLQELHAILLTMIQMIVRWTPVAIFSIVSSSLVVNVPTTWNFPSDATVPDGQLERMMSVPFAQAKLLSSSFFESESIADMGIPALVGVYGVGTILHCVVLLPLFTLAMIQQNPFAYAKQLARPLGIGFCIASSLASLPMVTEAMFVCRSASKELTQAVLSLGTIMHLDGAAFYFASCITFLVRTQGMDLTGDLAAKILLVSVIHSWSCPPLPHGGILTLGALWYTIAPGEMYHRNFSALVAIDFVLDRLCTLMSVWSNTLVLRIIADQTQELYYDDATGDDDASVVVEAPEGALNYDDYGDVLLSSRQFSYMPEIAPAPQ
ncbi:hypothetical protein DYB32_002010, partial [Aphanomyces invadans]